MTRAQLARLGISLAIAAAAVPTLGVGPAHACSCAERLTDAQYRQQAEAVFTGSLVGREAPNEAAFEQSGADPVVYTFAVDRVYKGAITNPQRVVSNVDGAACGLEPRGNGPFLVYTSRRDGSSAIGASWPAEYAELPRAFLCSGTREVKAGEKLPLGRGRAPAAAPPAAPSSEGPDTLGPTSDEEEDSGNGTAVALGIAAVALIGGGLVLRRRAGGR